MGNKPVIPITEKEILYYENNTFFTEKEIRKIRKRYMKFCSYDGSLNREQFTMMFSKLKNNKESLLIVEHIFRTSDEDGDDSLTFKEFLLAMSVTTRGTTRQRAEWLFHLYDINKDGTIEISEIQRVMQVFMRKNELKDLQRIFKQIDSNNDGVLTEDEFVDGCCKDHTLMEYLGIDR